MPIAVWGGGILCSNFSHAIIESNVIEYNLALFYNGGGIGAAGRSDCEITDNIITNNRAANGGGISAVGTSSPIIRSNIVSYNMAESSGGINLNRGSAIVAFNQICNNESFGNYGFGGGLAAYFLMDYPEIYNNTICNNSSQNVSQVILSGWTGWKFYNNICRGDEPAISVYENSSIQITHCNVEGGYPGEGNIDCDPGFCDSSNDDFLIDLYSCSYGTGGDSLGNPDASRNIGALGVGCNLSGTCVYITGDVNNSGGYNGLDVTYGVNFFKGGINPIFECECTSGDTWYVSGDVNGSCSYNGLDVT